MVRFVRRNVFIDGNLTEIGVQASPISQSLSSVELRPMNLRPKRVRPIIGGGGGNNYLGLRAGCINEKLGTTGHIF